MTETSLPRIFIAMATRNIGGPGKGLLQFFRCGGKELCSPYVCSYSLSDDLYKWPFREAVEALSVPFLTVRQRLAIDPLLIFQAYSLICKHNLQILQSHEYKSHVLCLALKIFTGRPWVGFVHGWTTENWKVRLYHSFDRIILRFADRIVIVAESMRSKVTAMGIDGSKIVTIKNAIDLKVSAQVDESAQVRSRFGVKDNEKLIGVIGRLSSEKGQIYFLEALKLISAKHQRVKGILVGDGPDEGLLRAKIKSLGLEESTIFAGYQVEVAPFFQACDLVVLPSLSEGMPNAALEAMQYEKPVVATRVGGVSEVIIDNLTGLLVEPADPKALADAVLSLLENPVCAAKYGLAGRLRVEEEFDPRIRVEKIVELYRELLHLPHIA
jgi:glycosyltransferase involved in cell wall biosynthesis